MRVADHLLAARALIDTPEKWTTGADARRADGEAVPATHKDAVRFCMTGSLCAVGAFNSSAYGLLRRTTERHWLMQFNDAPKRTHAQVMAAFDEAIALAEGGES